MTTNPHQGLYEKPRCPDRKFAVRAPQDGEVVLDLSEFSSECVADHLENGVTYGCDYTDEEFATFWMAGAAGDECRKASIERAEMHKALKLAWNERA